jgi:hypothetical protein
MSSDVEVRMVFREVSVTEVREVLRAWLGGAGLRTVAQRAGVDRKTARRYVAAAEAAGVVRGGGVAQLTDEVIGQVVAALRPARAGGHGCDFQSYCGVESSAINGVHVAAEDDPDPDLSPPPEEERAPA